MNAYLRILGRDKTGKTVLRSDEEIIANAIEQEKSGVVPHYAMRDNKTGDIISPRGWIVWSLYDGGCGVVYRNRFGRMVIATGHQGDFCYC